MATTATSNLYRPKDLAHGDRVTIEDSKGNTLTGLLQRKEADNKLEISLTMSAFGKTITVATWKAGTGVRGNGRWTSSYAVTHREATLW